MVDFAHPYILGYMKRVYGKPQFGNIWEADGTVVEGKKFWLIIVRDLKTCFPLGKAFSDKEDELVVDEALREAIKTCLLYTSPSPRDLSTSRMPSSA